MAPYNTAYLVIPKEKAKRIITVNVKYIEQYKNDDGIKLGYNKGSRSPEDYWRVSLYDYKFEGEKVETPDGSIETGVLGTKMNYHSGKTSASDSKEAVSKFIETG